MRRDTPEDRLLREIFPCWPTKQLRRISLRLFDWSERHTDQAWDITNRADHPLPARIADGVACLLSDLGDKINGMRR